MESSGDTHYVSFLSGEGGGMGRSINPFSRSSGRSAKRYFFGLRLKVHLLVAAAFVSLILGCGFFLWLTQETSDVPFAPPHPFNPVETEDGGASAGPNGDFPLQIHEWEERHFALAFSRFMSDHAKSYASLEEKEKRYKIFRANLVYIHLHNEQGHSYELGMNKFGDWTREEFGRFASGVKPNRNSLQRARLGVAPNLLDSEGDLPSSVDWRSKNCVTPVKDQGQCGSCWAFSTTGAIEGGYCAKTNKLLSLSEQMLMDCSRQFGNNSCNGGLMDDAFSYVAQKGLCTEKDYPYEAKDRTCRDNRCVPQVHIKGFYDVPTGNEDAMKAALARHGPVSIAIQADQLEFQFYKKGIFDAPCGANLDHGVLLVGYGSDEKSYKDYFIMKNSWGAGWGEHGYMLMAQHKGKTGQCGLLLSGSFPLMEGEVPPTN